jgi:hypothetical protein
MSKVSKDKRNPDLDTYLPNKSKRKLESQHWKPTSLKNADRANENLNKIL